MHGVSGNAQPHTFHFLPTDTIYTPKSEQFTPCGFSFKKNLIQNTYSYCPSATNRERKCIIVDPEKSSLVFQCLISSLVDWWVVLFGQTFDIAKGYVVVYLAFPRHQYGTTSHSPEALHVLTKPQSMYRSIIEKLSIP